MAGGSSRDAYQVSQLVECAESLGTSPGHRSDRFSCFVDGKLCLDAAGERRDAAGTKAGNRAGDSSPTRSERVAHLSERWKLGRRLSTRRRGDAENLERRAERDARVAERKMG